MQLMFYWLLRYEKIPFITKENQIQTFYHFTEYHQNVHVWFNFRINVKRVHKQVAVEYAVIRVERRFYWYVWLYQL